MAAKKINLDSIVSKCVHRPIMKGDAEMTPLYKRNDGIFDNINGKTTRSDLWLRAVENNFSSPNNVKRVFITYEGVYLHYFKPSIGDKSGELSKFYPYTSVDSEVDMMQAYQSKRRNDREITITKLGLSSVKKPWSCSNIEELYFDWSVLLSDDIQNYGYADLIQKMTSKGTTVVNDGRILWDLFSRSCLNSGEKLANTFPRLKVIGYIDNLKEVYNIIGKPRETSIETAIKLWFNSENMRRVISDPNTFVCVYKVPNVATYNTKFITRSYYSFDVEVLTPYFDKLSKDITNMIREKQGTLVKQSSEVTQIKEIKPVVKSEYELALDECLPTVGESGVYMSLKMMLNNLGKEKWLQLFREMSNEGRNKYQGIYSKYNKGGNN